MVSDASMDGEMTKFRVGAWGHVAFNNILQLITFYFLLFSRSITSRAGGGRHCLCQGTNMERSKRYDHDHK